MLLGAITLGAEALAQDARDAGDLARAAQAMQRAVVDEDDGAWDKALGELTEASQLGQKETPLFLFLLGRSHANLGSLMQARDELQRAVELAGEQRQKDLARQAVQELSAVQAGIASLTLTPPPDGDVGEATIDGGATKVGFGQTVPLDPGTHAVHVTFVGRSPIDLTVTLGRGENGSLSIPARGAIIGSPLGAVVAGERRPRTSFRTLGWTMVGGGGAMLIGGVVLWVLRDDAVSTLTPVCGPTMHMCPPPDQSTIDHGRLYDVLGVTLMVVGGATAIAGGGLIRYTGPRGATGRVNIAPLVGSTGGGIAVGGSLW